MKPPLPAIFFGHGNPMNSLRQNAYTRGWAAIGASLPRPRAIVAVSAHWYGAGTAVTALAQPRTIHDFGGFPPELSQVQYPAPGNPALAARVQALLAPVPVTLDQQWGLDHGTWSVLCHVFPRADVPVIQLSLDAAKPAAWHYEMAQRLAPLRDEGVLVLGSGNLIHNLRLYQWENPASPPLDWAERFETQVRALLQAGEVKPLLELESLGEEAQLAVPTPEHYLPLLYVLALRRAGESIRFPVEGFEGGAISMLTVQVG
jgi:4,5-DOPA dioxygenase extradiol